METTLAFVLGMSVVVVIALAVVAVIGFVKAIKTEKALNEQMKGISMEIDNRVTNIDRMLNELIAEVHRRIDETHRSETLEREQISRNIIEGDEFLHKRMDDVLKESEKHYEHIHRRMDDILSQMDSRFDKMITRIDKAKENLVDNKIILKD
jgi:arylsulfatase A-like enzyme